MDTKLKKSYFACDTGSYYYLGEDKEIRTGDLYKILEMHGSDRPEFEQFMDKMNDGKIGVCTSGEYVYVDENTDDKYPFKHIPESEFKKLIRDVDTIRLRYKPDNIILLQYNPQAVTV